MVDPPFAPRYIPAALELQSNNLRAEKILRQRYPSLSRRQVEEAFAERLVVASGGGPLAKGTKGETLDCARFDAHLAELRLGNAALEIPIVGEGKGYVVVDKPAGIAGHPLSLFDRDTITHWAFAKFPETREAFPEIQPTLTPHRLDTGTSGLLVVATSAEGFREWRGRFEKKEVEKEYLAWCWGRPSEKVFDINYGIGHRKGDPSRMAIPSKGEPFEEPVLEAQSIVKVERVLRDRFLARVACRSGVTHQVRVHLAAKGFPLVGDAAYDPAFAGRSDRPERHLLRAVRLDNQMESFTADETEFSAVFH